MAGNRQVWLKSRPNGIPQAENFGIRDGDIPLIAEGEFLVQNHYLSSDPAARGWIADATTYWPRIEIGDTMRAFAVGEIIESRNSGYSTGEKVMGLFGWQEYAAATDKHVNLKIAPRDLPLSLYLGVLGLNGFTAYFGLLDVGLPKAGDTVVVSTAAGAVGSCVGQIAKIKGCRTVGIAGGAEKVRQCLHEFGFDAAIDYKAGIDLDEALRSACPEGVNVYFDNTSGSISDAVLRNLALGARIVICGTASYPSWNPWNMGPRPERHLLVKRSRMQGFLATDFLDRFPEAEVQISQWIKEGRINYREEIHEGVRQGVVLAPQQGVTHNQKGEPTALVVGPDNTVELRTITTDRAIGDQWLVSSGLKPGDRVIVEGIQSAKPGAKVAPEEYRPASEKTAQPPPATAQDSAK